MATINDLAQLDLNQRYPYAEYGAWKFPGYVELINGQVIHKETPFTNHQTCLGSIAASIGLFCKMQRVRPKVYMRPFDVRLLHNTGNGDAQIKTVVQPDLSVICDLSKIDKRGCLGAPDWIVEIISPNSLVLDTRTKFDLYAENGVREYWIVFPGEQAVTAYALNAEGQYELTATYAEPGPMPSHILPELAIEWADIFEETK